MSSIVYLIVNSIVYTLLCFYVRVDHLWGYRTVHAQI